MLRKRISYRVRWSAWFLLTTILSTSFALATDLRLGIIGTDTSHVIEFTKLLNDPIQPGHVSGAIVVAAFKGDSPDIPISRDGVDGFSRELQQKWHVRVASQIGDLCPLVIAAGLVYGLAPRSAKNACADAALQGQAKKIYAVQCALCHGAEARGGEYGPALAGNSDLRGKSAGWLHDVIKNGIPSEGMPAFNLPPADLNALASWIESMNIPATQSAESGNRLGGEQYFFGVGKCASCHMVAGRGSVSGPDLSSISGERTVQEIQESLLEPSHNVTPGYESMTVKLRNGQTLHGFEPLDPRWCGFYFDLGHASVDLGEYGWKVATNLVLPRLKMVGAKDFIWKERGPHRWHEETCPMGQGIVPWRQFLHILAQSNFHGPISLQQEFMIPGVTDDQGIAVSRAAVPQLVDSAKANLDYLKSLLRDAYQQI